MKAFFVGLLFVIAAALFVGLGLLLMPFLLLMAIIARIVIILILGIVAIWLLGKFIIWVWESLRGK